jgi:hypothetical protein
LAFNGAGTFARIYSWVSDKAANVKITASRMDAEMDGFATGLSTCITKDGQTTVTANLPMNSKKHTGVAAGTARTDYADVGSVQDDLYAYVSTVGGTANAITLTPSPAITAYAAGQRFKFLAGASNTSAVTVAVSGLTTKAVQLNTAALAGGEIVSGKYYALEYDGTAFQLLGARNPQVPLWCGTSGGTANAQTATPSPAIAAYSAGQLFQFTAGATNTGATTLAVSGLTAKNVQLNGVALAGGEIVSGRTYEFLYDGTQFQLFNARDPQISLWCGTGAGTANAQTATPSPAIGAIQTGGRYVFIAGATNTAAATLAISGLTAKNIYLGGAALNGGEIVSGRVYTVLYDGTQFNIETGSELQQGIHEFWIPASALTANTTNGPSSGTTELTTNKNMLVTKDYDQTTAESAQCDVVFPKSWNLGTITFKPVWTAASGSGAVVVEVAGVATRDDDAMDVAFGTGQTSTDTLITANDCHIGPESSAITIAGTLAAGVRVNLRVKRLPADAGDTLAADMKLLGIRVRFGINAGNDA